MSVEQRIAAAQELWSIMNPGFAPLEKGHPDWTYYNAIASNLLDSEWLRERDLELQKAAFDEGVEVVRDQAIHIHWHPQSTGPWNPHEASLRDLREARDRRAAGWVPWGTHDHDSDIDLEFEGRWGGVPRWERPVRRNGA